MREDVSGWVELTLALGALCALVWTGIKAADRIGRRARDWEAVVAALTPNHGTSVHDLVARMADLAEAGAVAVARVEAGLADHCRQAGKRMEAIELAVQAANSRTDRALELLAGAPVRATDRAAHTRAADRKED